MSNQQENDLFLQNIAGRTGMPLEDAENLFKALIEEMSSQLRGGNEVEFKNFGKFRMTHLRDQGDGTKVGRPSFSPSEKLRKLANTPLAV